MTLSTRATIHVPSPETSMSLGRAWSGTDWNADGFSAVTDGRVWLDANGDDRSSSTLTLRSNGGGEDGQLLLQSLQANLYVLSNQHTLVSADKSVLIAGGEGVRLMGGHGTIYGFTLPWGATWAIVRDKSLERVGPSEDDPKSKHADGVVQRMDHVADYWSAIVGAWAVCQIVPESCRYFLGIRGVGTSAGTMAGLAAASFTFTMVRGAVEFGKLAAKDDIPGLQVHAYGSVQMATTGFASFTSGVAINFGGLLGCDFLGALSAGAFGGLGAHVLGCNSVDVNGTRVEMTAGKNVYLGTPFWRQEHNGVSITYGEVIPAWPTQVPTASIDVEALVIDALVTAGSVDVLTTGEVRINGMKSTTVKAFGAVELSSPTCTLKVSPAGVEISCLPTTKIVSDPVGSTFTLDNGAMKTVVDVTNGVTLGDAAGVSVLEVGPTATMLKGPVTFT
ncbi:MAG: hypothetical protein H6719_29490 [Sandaracinaceae bacterium]|nr:hypothetical protein [Sandaracinaceae bacterium]